MFAAALLLAACGSYVAGMRPDDRPHPEVAHVYGTFFIDAESYALALKGHQTMGFVLVCSDGNKYTIPFLNERRVQVIRLNPSRCSFDEVVYTDSDGIIRQRGYPRTVWSEDLSGGWAYYLGDFFASASHKVDFFPQKHRLRWGLNRVADNYDATTTQMKRTFVHMASIPTASKPLMPREDAREASAKAPPISPERAARIAGSTGSRFATPAECKRACGKGRCVPFRGDAGPAMTCVVGCEADGDCPKGLACNCPKGDGKDCKLIATTPEDAMEGICLPAEPAAAAAPDAGVTTAPAP